MCFQGNPTRHSSRYAAFNMMNLLPGNIGTLEIRIKDGSNDAKEIAMFIELFSRFLIAALKCQNIQDTINDIRSYFDDPNDEYYENNFEIEQLDYLFDFVETGLTKDESVVTLLSDVQAYWEQIRGLNYYHEEHDEESANLRQAKRPRIESQEGGRKLIPLFSYGSNHSFQICQRTRSKVPPQPHSAILPNHTRIFTGYSRRWKGGVASVHPCKGKHVQGALYYLTPEQISKLDGFEKGYKKVYKYVTLAASKRIKALVYVKEDFTWHSLPSKQYLEAIKKTLEEGKHKPIKHLEVWGLQTNKLYLYNTVLI